MDAVVLFLCGLKGSPQCSRISIVLGIRSIRGDIGSVLDKHPWSLNRCQPLFCSTVTLIQSVRESERERERERERETETERATSGRSGSSETPAARLDVFVFECVYLHTSVCVCVHVCVCTSVSVRAAAELK